MKKAIAIILVLISMLSLFACKDDDTPKGMQLARGSESEGYCFYVPEEWTLSNLPGISTAYVSTITSTSVSFAEISPLEFIYDSEQISEKDYFLTKYFNTAIGEFPGTINPTNVSGGETIDAEKVHENDIGEGHDEAYRPDAYTKYIFQYEYKTGEYYYTYRFTQYYIVKGARYYVLQYFGVAEKYTKAEDGTREMMDFDNEYNNSTYLEKFAECRKYLKLFGTAKNEEATPEGSSTEFIKVSDPKLAGFTMYAPTTFKVNQSDAVVSITAADGANVTLTQWVGASYTANTTMMHRKEELSQLVESFNWITGYKKDDDGNVITVNEDGKQTTDGTGYPFLDAKEINLGNLPKRDNQYNWSLAYEYEFTYCGDTYHVLQILATDVSTSDLLLNQSTGYVFTYTAKSDIYDLHIAEVYEIINKLEF